MTRPVMIQPRALHSRYYGGCLLIMLVGLALWLLIVAATAEVWGLFT